MTPTSPNAAAEHYLQERVMTASKAELTAMLFDACVGAIKLSVKLHELGQHAAAAPKLMKAQAIVMELRATLNPAAGELSDRLGALYTYAFGRLIEANTKQDTAAAREALEILEPLQQAWRQSCLGAVAA